MKLIINADDFGYTKGISQGIIDAHLNGIVTSTTVLMNSTDLMFAAGLAKQCKNLGIGVHLNLTLGKPLTNGETITDESGNFYKRTEIRIDNMDKEEIYEEWKAQIEKFKRVFNKMPTHLDSHHSVHDLPETVQITERLMKEYNLTSRRKSEFKFYSGFFGENATRETLIKYLKNNLNENAIEIMTHCGYSDQDLKDKSNYNDFRYKELQVLCDPILKKFIEDKKIKLVTY